MMQLSLRGSYLWCRAELSRKVVLPKALNVLVYQVRHVFDDKFSSDDKVKLLKILNDTKNTNKAEYFKQFAISKKNLGELLKVEGTIQNLEDLAPVINVKLLDKFFTSLLDKTAQNISSPMFPNVLGKEVGEISEVLSVNIVSDKISYCLIQRTKDAPIRVESLVQITYPYKPKMHFIDMLKEISVVAKEAPPCDLCIVEEYPLNIVPAPHLFQFQLQMAQAKAIFCGCMSALPTPPQFASIKTVAVARMFNTFIGSERVSGQEVVQDIITNSTALEITDFRRDQYLNSESHTKERLSNVFLLNLAYWKLTKQFK